MLPLEEMVRHIRRQRRLLDMTQMDLAKASGTSQSFIAKLEKGRLNPGYESVRRIHEALEEARLAEEDRAEDLMQRRPFQVAPFERVGVALAHMKQHGFSQLPVIDDGVPVGSLSESQLLRRIEAGEDLESLKRAPVADVMGGTFPTVAPDARRHTLVELLRDNEAVLVMDGGRLVGVVTKSDLW